MESFPNPGIKDFCDTAALIELADIVISVDTAVANLAGAMGAELWLFDRYDHDWRYSDIQTPWYPTARIFRQPKPWDWESVVSRIVDDLKLRSAKIAA
jgi:ADP-heptose:LPS heptosyltransferase